MKTNLKSAFINDPEILRILENKEQADLMRELVNPKDVQQIGMLIKGDKGDKGDTPVKHVDYFTPEELSSIIEYLRKILKEEVTPIKGIHYFDGEKGDQGESVKGDKGDRGEMGSADTPELIVAKLNTLEGEIEAKVIKGLPTLRELVAEIKAKKLIEMKDVRNMPLNMSDMRWHGGGPTLVAGTDITLTQNSNGTTTIAASTTGSQILTATGTINDSNVTFTFISQPLLLVINGAMYIPVGGAITWSYLLGTVTLSVPVGTNGSIYGIS